MEKVDSMQKRMGHVSRENETLRKKSKGNSRNNIYCSKNEECF